MSQKSGTPKLSFERVVTDIRRATCKQYSAEEKIRIVPDGLRGEHSIVELCRREGTVESLYLVAKCPTEWCITPHWSRGMIESFRDDWLRAFFVDEVRSKKIPAGLKCCLFRKLQMIDDATTDQDLRVPPSNHFEKLRGDLEGFYSIRVNKQWRRISQWDGTKGEVSGVYLDDHTYQ